MIFTRLGNYEESSENNEDHRNTGKSQNESRTTESPTRPETELSLTTSYEITTVNAAPSDAPPPEDD